MQENACLGKASSTLFQEAQTVEGMRLDLTETFSAHTTESSSEEEEDSDRTGIRVFCQCWDHTRAQKRNQPRSQSEKFSFLPKAYSRKHLASPIPTAVSRQLDMPVTEYSTENLQSSTLVSHISTKKEEEALDREIADLITKKAVEEVDFCQARFVSPMFIMPKKDRGRRRPVLQSMNQYVSKAHF